MASKQQWSVQPETNAKLILISVIKLSDVIIFIFKNFSLPQFL